MRIPLLAKILGGLFLNILVLAAVAGFFAQKHLGPEWIFPNSSRARVQDMAEVLAGELRRSPFPEWSGILGRFSEVYGFQFDLFDDREQRLAGQSPGLPAEVRDFLRRMPRPPRPQPPPPGRPEGHGLPPGAPPPNEPPRIFPSHLIVTHSPHAYWLAVEIPGPLLQRPGGPFVLAGPAPALGSSSLLFDPKPWILAAACALVLSALAWVPLVRSLTRAITEMTRAAETIAGGQFQVSVDERRRDELGRLGGAINRMAKRLDAYVRGQKRFLADAAHELCSPLARLEVALGVLEQRSGPELAQRVADAREEVREMSERVSELLDFSKAGLRRPDAKLEAVPLAELVDAVIRREGKNAEVRNEIPPGFSVSALPDLLSRAVANVLRNAVRYAAARGPVSIMAERENSVIALRIRDHGPGVPAGSLPHLFEAFYRPDPSRSRQLGGTGLGLAIVRSCVEACRGSVAARNLPDGGFEVSFSLQPAETFTKT